MSNVRTNNFFIAAEKRKSIKKASKKALRNNQIAAVIYNKENNIPIFFNRNEFKKVINKINPNSLIDIKVDNKNYLTFIKAVTYFPGRDSVEHIDFYKIEEDKKIKIKIPIEWEGFPVGIAKGGLIRRFSNDLFVECKSNQIPPTIKINIAHLEIGMGLFVRDLEPKPEVVFLESPDKAIISIVKTSKSKSTEETAESEEKKEAKEKKE